MDHTSLPSSPTLPILSRADFLDRWDNNSGAVTVEQIDNRVITPKEIDLRGGLVPLAKDYERLSPTSRQGIVVELSEPERLELQQAVANVRFRYLNPKNPDAAEKLAQRFDMRSSTARGRVHWATQHLKQMGLDPKNVKATQVIEDDLGHFHVRFDRMAGGRQVYGEQTVVHFNGVKLSISGTTTGIGKEIRGGRSVEQLQRVLAAAIERFEIDPNEVKVNEVVFRTEAGLAHGWNIELRNYAREDDGPRAMIFNVDADKMSIIESFVGVGGLAPTEAQKQAAKNKLAQPKVDEKAEVSESIKTLAEKIMSTQAAKKDQTATTHLDFKADAWTVHAKKERKQRPMPTTDETTDKPKTGELDQTRRQVPLDHILVGKGNDYVPYSGRIDLDTTKHGDEFALRAESWMHDGIETRDAKQYWNASQATLITDKDDLWGVGDAQAKRSGAAAHYGAIKTMEFLRTQGFNSIDLMGEELISNVNIRRDYVNAYWNGEEMHYGEGDGRQAGPLTTLDIAGHEIAHGLTERTANLIYANESGGLNESYSDIAGFMVEYHAAKSNPVVTPDWTMCEDT